MNINYGLIVFDPIPNENGTVTVFHFCGYENPPTEAQIEGLRRELETDEEFCLTGRMHEMEIMVAPQDVVDYHRELLRESGRVG
jgi:hypothetical protein